MNCPTCGGRMSQDIDEKWDHYARRWIVTPLGWSCERCGQDAALNAMRTRTPWLFRQTGSMDEHDEMSRMVAAGVDGWPVRR